MLAFVEPVNVWEYEAAAADRLDAGAYAYYAGGAGDEVTPSGAGSCGRACS